MISFIAYTQKIPSLILLSLDIFQLSSGSQMPENKPKIFWLKIKIFLIGFQVFFQAIDMLRIEPLALR